MAAAASSNLEELEGLLAAGHSDEDLLEDEDDDLKHVVTRSDDVTVTFKMVSASTSSSSISSMPKRPSLGRTLSNQRFFRQNSLQQGQPDGGNDTYKCVITSAVFVLIVVTLLLVAFLANPEM